MAASQSGTCASIQILPCRNASASCWYCERSTRKVPPWYCKVYTLSEGCVDTVSSMRIVDITAQRTTKGVHVRWRL